MASPRTPLVALRGSEAYGAFLDKLVREARSRGLPVRDRSSLAELCLNTFGESVGVSPPERARPLGANQHGTPSA